MVQHPGEGVFGIVRPDGDVQAEYRITNPLAAVENAGWDMRVLLNDVVQDLIDRVNGLMQRPLREDNAQWVQVYLVVEGLDMDGHRSVSTPHMRFTCAQQLVDKIFEILENALQSGSEESENIMDVTERTTLLSLSLDVLCDDRVAKKRKQPPP